MRADLIAVPGRDFDFAPLFMPALLEHDAARRDARLRAAHDQMWKHV